MVNELMHAEEDKTTKVLLKAYKDLSLYAFIMPGMDAIRNHYNVQAENELFQFTAVQYGYDYYDGSEEKSANFLPDSMREDTTEILGIALDLSEEEISRILVERQYCFLAHSFCINPPLQEVW